MAKAEQSRTTPSSADFEIPVQLMATDGSREAISARIRRVNSGFFQLRTTKAIEIGRKFSMEYESCRAELEVIYCQRPAVGACFVGTRVLTGGESSVRKDVRLPLHIPAKASVPGAFEGSDVIVKAISPSGLTILLPALVEDGSMIAIDMGHGIMFGEMRQCKPGERGEYHGEMTLEEFLPRDGHESSMAGQRQSSSEGPGFLRRLFGRSK